MNYLIFDSFVGGHHIEYCHHLYDWCIQKQNDTFIFLLNPKSQEAIDKFKWQESGNVQFLFLNPNEVGVFAQHNLLKTAFEGSRIIKEYIRKYDVNHVFLIMFMQLMPFLLFFLPKGVKVSGVIYRLFLYDTSSPFLSRVLHYIRFFLIAHSSHVARALILNDADMALRLNKLYRTSKFQLIPDPIPNLAQYPTHDIREELSIRPTDRMYLHFGGLGGRKGTLDIVKAILLLNDSEVSDKVFVFAGRIADNSERGEFVALLNEAKSKGARCIWYNEFCSNELLCNLCFSTNVILIPYHNVTQSSGVIGWAAWFDKPVISPAEGLLGSLVKSYKLGITIPGLNIERLAESFSKDAVCDGSEYRETHNVNSFISAI